MKDQKLTDFLHQVEQVLTESTSKGNAKHEYGIVESVADGVIAISGLPHLKMSEIVDIKGTSAQALIMNLEQGLAKGLILGDAATVSEGAFVASTGTLLSLPVGEALVSRVIDPLGLPLDGRGAIKSTDRYPLEKVAPGVMTRQSVSQPLQTGYTAIDALVPIGRGQRELIIGDRQTGKTTLAIDTIINQKDSKVVCVYVAIGQREAKLAQVYQQLREAEAMNYTIIVSAPASSNAALQFLAPYAGAAVAEYFCDKGLDVLVIYDDLSKHAVSYREISLLLKRPPGREAYPGDVFYLHSRLLERAVKLNKDFGGGSITALPIIETQAGDVSAYIPTNVISITDGQIFLDGVLFNKGIRPAINVGISVSRVGGAAQTKVMKKVAGTVKLDLAQYYELESFSQFASDLDDKTKATLNRGKAIVTAFNQKQGEPYNLWQEIVVLYAASRGYLDNYSVTEIPDILKNLLHGVGQKGKDLIQIIEIDKDLTEKAEDLLKKHIQEILK
jgi:F-type H+-transporting ATPase subunit alpha